MVRGDAWSHRQQGTYRESASPQGATTTKGSGDEQLLLVATKACSHQANEEAHSWWEVL